MQELDWMLMSALPTSSGSLYFSAIFKIVCDLSMCVIGHFCLVYGATAAEHALNLLTTFQSFQLSTHHLYLHKCFPLLHSCLFLKGYTQEKMLNSLCHWLGTSPSTVISLSHASTQSQLPNNITTVQP